MYINSLNTTSSPGRRFKQSGPTTPNHRQAGRDDFMDEYMFCFNEFYPGDINGADALDYSRS